MYAYAANNPVKYTDPDGRKTFYTKYDKYGNEQTQGPDINLNPQNAESQYKRAQSHVRIKDIFIVAAHGNRRYIYEFSGYSKDSPDRGKERRILPQELAERIKNHKNFKDGMVVVLWSCNVGNDPMNESHQSDNFAQQLADALGEGSVVLAPSGSITVGYGNEPNKIVNDDGTSGKMIKFIGRRKQNEVSQEE